MELVKDKGEKVTPAGAKGATEGEQQAERPYVGAIRNRLLAHIHVAQRQLGMTDEHYRILLEALFDQTTAAALTIEQLHYFVKYMKESMGWQPLIMDFKGDKAKLVAFRSRATEYAAQLTNGAKRLQGLCRSICGVESVDWCEDLMKLRKLLAALGNIVREEQEKTEAEKKAQP